VSAQKFLDDEVYNDYDYAKVKKISMKKFALLESYFLALLDFKLFCTTEDFEIFVNYISKLIESEIKKKKDLKSSKNSTSSSSVDSSKLSIKKQEKI